MEKSGIEWTDHTWNPWWGCHKVSPGCKVCYIAGIMLRAGKEPFGGPIRTADATWRKAFRWQREAARGGPPPWIFTCSMSDFFHVQADRWRTEAWDVIRACPELNWLLLTKRTSRLADKLPIDWDDGWPHVCLGATVETDDYRWRLDDLLSVPAAWRFVSAEPLLGPLDLHGHLATGEIDWVIAGCEQAAVGIRRSMELDWVRDLRDQCAAAGVAFFLKQRYVGTQLVKDGVLDGLVCREWPVRPNVSEAGMPARADGEVACELTTKAR